MVYMNHTELTFQDLLLYCSKKVPENHNNCFDFRHMVETHFLMLAQTLIYMQPVCSSGIKIIGGGGGGEGGGGSGQLLTIL